MRARCSALSLAPAILLAALTACSSSKSTSPQSTTQTQAELFDSLAQQANAGGYFDRGRLLSYPTAVLAEGVPPTSVSISINGSTQKFSAVGAELLQTAAGSNSGTPTDSDFVIVAWQGTDVSTLLYFQIATPDTINDAAYLADTVVNENLTGGSATASLVNSSGSCSLLDLTTAAPLVQGATCTKATIGAGFNVVYTPITGASDSTFILSSGNINGVRLVLPVSTGGQDKIAPVRLLDRRLAFLH